VTAEAVPRTALARVASAQAGLEVAIAPLGDDAVRAPSRLPGWTVGHLLTHLARNADSHRRRTEGAARGQVVEQYPGGFEGRAAEIEAGARRPAAALRADVAHSAAALAAAWAAVPDDAWDRPTVDVAGRRRPLRDLVDRRWQEVEVHLVDLGVGPTQRDWSDEFVADRLPRLRVGVGARLPAGATAPDPDVLDERDELAWLYGRLDLPELPQLSPWV
jgi:maleylpyruvate isomerase